MDNTIKMYDTAEEVVQLLGVSRGYTYTNLFSRYGKPTKGKCNHK
jgi:hypothetical protein